MARHPFYALIGPSNMKYVFRCRPRSLVPPHCAHTRSHWARHAIIYLKFRVRHHRHRCNHCCDDASWRIHNNHIISFCHGHAGFVRSLWLFSAKLRLNSSEVFVNFRLMHSEDCREPSIKNECPRVWLCKKICAMKKVWKYPTHFVFYKNDGNNDGVWWFRFVFYLLSLLCHIMTDTQTDC